MAFSDDAPEGSISSFLVDSLKSNQSEDDLSPEEIAWVDSCLVKDLDISDGDWSSMKHSLIEILGLQPESVTSHDSVGPLANGFSVGTDIEMLLPVESETVKSSRRSDADSICIKIIDKEMELVHDDFPVNEKADESVLHIFQGSETSLRNAFLPHYREDNLVVGQSNNSGSDIIGSTSAYEMEALTENIFKVWDLGIAPEEEEDGLVKQLNKALEASSQSMPDELKPSNIDDSRSWKDLKEKSLDDLITGIADLSLNHHSN